MRYRFSSVIMVAAAISLGAAASGFAEGLERTAQAGGVMASATPTNFKNAGAATIDFTVALNTHSFPLTFDHDKDRCLERREEGR